MKKEITLATLLLVSCGQQPMPTEDTQGIMPAARQAEAPAQDTQAPVVTSEALPPGDICPAGGLLVTVNGVATPICNGVDGEDGAQGQDGQNGAAGAPGSDGQGFPTFKVIASTGVEIGSLAWVNPANSDYWVISGDRRMQFSRTVGHFPNAYMFCSLPACGGECRVAITNGVFANVFEVYDTGAVVQATGRASSTTFAYQSRRMGSSCTNTAGTTSGLYTFNTLTPETLGFAYPLEAVELLNTAE